MRRHFDRVNIIKRIKADGQWGYAEVVERGGEIVPDLVWVRGIVESHPEGSYTLDWYENGHRRHESIGTLQQAHVAARAKLGAKIAESIAGGQLRISAAIERYLDQIEARRTRSTFLTYRSILRSFQELHHKMHVSQVQRDIVLDFVTRLSKQGLANSTAENKLVEILQCLKFFGQTKLLASSDWPICVETIRPTYDQHELEAMFRSTNGSEKLLLQFLLASGFRDREVQYLTWRDIDWRDSSPRRFIVK